MTARLRTVLEQWFAQHPGRRRIKSVFGEEPHLYDLSQNERHESPEGQFN
jgi:hypothetical protein